MPITRTRLLCATSILAVTCLGQAASAQAESAAGPVDLGTLILGELQTRTTQDSSTSAVVETGEALEERGDTDVYNLVERTPNISTTYGNKGFVVRGIQTNGAVERTQLNGTLVSVQVDGVALNNYQSTFFGPYSSWDLEQVEILRGPQSTQQGRNALAGAVIVNTRDPEFYEEYKFRIEGGSRNTQRYALALNQPLSDTVALRFAAENSGTDGWVTSEKRGDDKYDARSYEAYRGKVLWAPSDQFEAVLEYSYTDSKGGEDYVLESRFPAERVTMDTADAVEGSVHKNLGLTTRYVLNDAWTLETETNFYDQDYTRLEGDAPANAMPSLDVGRSFSDFSSESSTFEQDIRVRYTSDRINGTVGIFYTEVEDTRPSRVETNLLVFDQSNPNLASMSDTISESFSTEVRNFAVFGEADIKLSDTVTLTVGARYDREDYSYTNSVDFGDYINGLGIDDLPESTGDRSFDAFLPKLGLTYDFAPDQAISFSAQRGYRAGGASSNLIEAIAGIPNSISNYDPEFSTTYEFAYRGAFNDGATRLSGNVFYTDWSDMQISVPGTQTGSPLDPLFNYDTVNAARAELYGFELSFETQASDELELFGSLGYVHTRFKDFVSGSNDYSGNELPFAPNWTGNFGGKYTWDNGFALAADVSYKGAAFQNSANSITDDARWLVNAHATYDINEQVVAGFYVRNLLDKDYATDRYIDPLQQTFIRTGEPRTLGLYLQATF